MTQSEKVVKYIGVDHGGPQGSVYTMARLAMDRNGEATLVQILSSMTCGAFQRKIKRLNNYNRKQRQKANRK